MALEMNSYSSKPAENEHFFSNWINYTKELVIYISLDFKILEFNPMAEKIYGWTRAEAIGENYLTLCKKSGFNVPLPENVSQILAGNPLQDVENIIGNDKFILIWTITRTLDNKKAPNGFLLLGQDITQFRQTEIALQKAEEYAIGTNEELASFNKSVTGQNTNSNKLAVEYARSIYEYMENIVAAMPGSVYWMNRQCIYLGCNDNMAKLFNLKSRHEIIGKTYADLYDAKSGSSYREADTEVMNTGVAKTLEEPLYNPDGTKSIYLSSKVPLRDITGAVIGMLGISIDITERKKAEEVLEEAKKRAEAANLAKSEFLAVISHELRIPLTSILGMTQLLSMQNLLPEKQQEYLQHISNAGMHLLNLINDTLDFAKLEASQFELALVPMDLKSLIEETTIMLTPLAKAKNLELLIHFDSTIPSQILGDKRALRQIIINLMGNGIKFTERGYVSIQVECIEETQNAAKLVISVSDTGIGIPEDKQGMIFDHFSQVDASHSRPYGGAGLGLTITKQLIELMNGTIGVTSQVGKGSTFRCVIEVPLQKEAIMTSPWMTYESTVRTLLVDDTPRGKTIQRQLSPSNSQVATGKEAFNTLLAAYQLGDPYSIVIIDQHLNDVNPFELAQTIHKHQKLYQPMLVLLTNNSSINSKESAKSVGFFECIAKPIQPLALQTVLTTAWERWIEERTTQIPVPSINVETKTISPNTHNAKKLKILLVEDDPIVQIIHYNYLEQLDCTVEIANNGKEALNKLNNQYDLVFMDMGLPDIHGNDVVKEFRKKSIGKKHTPIVSLTGYSSEMSKQEFLASGVDEVAIKPVFLEQLEKILQKYCGKKLKAENKKE